MDLLWALVKKLTTILPDPCWHLDRREYATSWMKLTRWQVVALCLNLKCEALTISERGNLLMSVGNNGVESDHSRGSGEQKRREVFSTLYDHSYAVDIIQANCVQ